MAMAATVVVHDDDGVVMVSAVMMSILVMAVLVMAILMVSVAMFLRD